LIGFLLFVIPAKAGIQLLMLLLKSLEESQRLDPGFRRDDEHQPV
jgi:hypothetical protein